MDYVKIANFFFELGMLKREKHTGFKICRKRALAIIINSRRGMLTLIPPANFKHRVIPD